ncbi:MAG: glycosyltransferase [Acidimicrobiales bacterium]|nr:glycosyltransferase [Acidimicrobiales bacterium]
MLWLIKGLGPGGAEQLLVEQARARSADSPLDVHVAYLVPWKDQLVEALVEAGATVHALDAPRDGDPRWWIRLRRLLVDVRIDVVHAHSPLVAAQARLVTRTLPARHRPALVYTEHNRWPRHRPTTRTVNRLTFPLDDAQFAVSDDVRDTISARLRRRVQVLVHGIDVEAVAVQHGHRDEVRAELDVPDDTVVVGIVANLRREKAYDDWLDAAAEALREEPRLRFVSVGQGPLADELHRRHEELGLGDRVRMLGYRPDATRVMSGFDVFTLTSRHEGLPVALMEALALGLPVVATRVGGIPQAVDDGVEADLVPVGRPDLLAAAYVALARDPARRSRLSGAARARSGAFTIDPAARRLEALYVELAAARRAASAAGARSASRRS